MLRKNHEAVAGLILLIFIVLAGIFGPYVYPGDPFEMVWAPFSPPGDEGYFLGTDYLGRDLTSMPFTAPASPSLSACPRRS